MTTPDLMKHRSGMIMTQTLKEYQNNGKFRVYLRENIFLRNAYRKALRGEKLNEAEAMEINEAWSAANEL